MLIAVTLLVAIVALTAATQYDYRVILMMQQDEIVEKYAQELYSKHEKGQSPQSLTILQWNGENFEGFKQVKGVQNFRTKLGGAKMIKIYVIARGSKDSEHVGKCKSDELGMILRNLIGDGTAIANIKRIKLVTINEDNDITPLKCSYLSELLIYLHKGGIETEISTKNPPCGDNVPKECMYNKIIAYMKDGQEDQKIENYNEEEIEVEHDVKGIGTQSLRI